jgi:hypothetical protein
MQSHLLLLTPTQLSALDALLLLIFALSILGCAALVWLAVTVRSRESLTTPPVHVASSRKPWPQPTFTLEGTVPGKMSQREARRRLANRRTP